MKRLVIYGAGAHARKVCHSALAGGWRVECFVDDARTHAPLAGYELLPGASLGRPDAGRACIVAIGDSDARRRLAVKLAADGWRIAAVIHPGAWVAPDAIVGDGAFIGAGAIVETGAKVGAGAIIDVGAIVDHDCVVADHVHLRAGEVLHPGTHFPLPPDAT